MELTQDRGPVRQNRLLILVLLVAFLVIFAYGITGAALIQAFEERTYRCYPIAPPLTQLEKMILEGEGFICSSELCRLVGRLLPDNGLVCFFPPPPLLRSF